PTQALAAALHRREIVSAALVETFPADDRWWISNEWFGKLYVEDQVPMAVATLQEAGWHVLDHRDGYSIVEPPSEVIADGNGRSIVIDEMVVPVPEDVSLDEG